MSVEPTQPGTASTPSIVTGAPPRVKAGTLLGVRWEWYSDEVEDLRPYWHERHRSPRGERLAQRPDGSVHVVGYGYDERGRVAVRQERSGFLDGRITLEATRRYGDGVVEETAVDGDGVRVYEHRYRYRDGLLWTFESTARYGDSREEYTYSGGRLTSIAVTHNGRPYQQIAVQHDGSGTLQRIRTTWLQGRPHTEVTYRRPPAGFTLDEQARRVAAMLEERVPQAVARAGIAEPAYCLALAYDDVSCVPVLGLGLESERRPGEDPWNPAEFEHFDIEASALHDPVFRDEADLFDQEIALAGEWHRIRDLLLDVARELDGYDWPAVVPVTADFLVYPVDLEGADRDRNLHACRPDRFPTPY